MYALDTAAGEEVWRLDAGAPVVALTLVGNVLVASTHAALVAVDARSGAASWTTASQDVRWTAPSLLGSALVVTGTDLKLTAVNLADGTVRWRHDLCGNQPVRRVHRQFFINSFLGDDAAVLARSSGEEPASPRHRAGVASMAWRTTR